MTAVALGIRTPDLLDTAPVDLVDHATRRDSTPAEARERADRLRAGIVRYAEMRQDIADAWAGRDWIALDYQDWPAYVAGEFGTQLGQLARPERQQAIGDLRGQGMSVRQISSATGASYGTVRNDLAEVSKTAHLPEKVTGSDGKDYAATRPAPKPTQTPGPVAAPTSAPTGPGSTSPEPGRHLSLVTDAPAPPSPEQVEAERMETSRVQLVERARRKAPRLVHEIRGLINEVVAGLNLGERDLVTPEMVAEIRAAVDILEARMEATR